MVTKISKNAFRNLLDECGFRNRVDKDGDFVVQLDADENFNYDVIIWFIINEESGTIQALAEAVDFEVSENEMAHALIKCNEWNKKSFTQAFLLENRFRIRNSVFNDEPISESFIIENLIKFSLSNFWQFFCSTVK